MALPKAYLTSTKNVDAILTAIQQGQAPKSFSTRFLEGLGFKSNHDRLIIGVLKALRFLDDSGAPTQRYFEYLDQTQAPRVLAEGIREAYADLYQLNTKAHDLPKADIKGKMKTLTQGQYSESVLDKMTNTLQALAKNADFDAVEPAQTPASEAATPETPPELPEISRDGQPAGEAERRRAGVGLGGLVYNIQIQLPESRDPAVYDALFRSLRTHLLP